MARQIKRVILHCSDSPDAWDIGADKIAEWHKEKGFRTIGYHVVVRRDGTIEKGRPEHEIGAHVKGHNSDSLGICIIGRKDFAPVQILAVVAQIKEWMVKYKIPAKNVLGHYELDDGKTCPNLKMELVRKCL